MRRNNFGSKVCVCKALISKGNILLDLWRKNGKVGDTLCSFLCGPIEQLCCCPPLLLQSQYSQIKYVEWILGGTVFAKSNA